MPVSVNVMHIYAYTRSLIVLKQNGTNYLVALKSILDAKYGGNCSKRKNMSPSQQLTAVPCPNPQMKTTSWRRTIAPTVMCVGAMQI